MSDTGEDAIRRERESAEAREGNFLWRADEADERTTIERTDAENEAFRAKLQEWRRTGGVPAYTGPKAAR